VHRSDARPGSADRYHRSRAADRPGCRHARHLACAAIGPVDRWPGRDPPHALARIR